MPPDPGSSPTSIQYNFGDNVQIQADVFGGTKQETNVYLLRAATGQVDWRGYRDQRRAPYRFLDSYALLDAGIYAGRAADVDRLERETLVHRLVVLQGPVGAGKTSLLRAGLTPRLMQRGYLVLAAQDYTNPTVALVNALADAREQLRVDLSGASDLVSLVRAAQRSLDRPVVLILDHFEQFFSDPTLGAAGRERFRAELAALRSADFRHPSCMILSLRQQSQGELAYFQQPPTAPAVPDIYHHIVSLDLLSREGAKAAILAPLDGLDPPMVFDPDFLDRLLDDLTIPERGIDPPHLQIACSALYDAARALGQNFINARLYEGLGGREGILGGYLERALRAEFPDETRYALARDLLKAMVSASGELVYLSPDQAAARVGQPAHLVQPVLDALNRRSLLLSRTERTFGLAHPIMAQSVLAWSDLPAAELRWAQETVDRAWQDWLAWDRLREMPATVGHPQDGAAPLLDRARLPVIAARQQELKLSPGQRVLLLRSAVAAGVDPAAWLAALAEDQAALDQIRALQAGETDLRDASTAQLGRALGLDDIDAGDNLLGRACVADLPAGVRHAVALALAALGATVVKDALLDQRQGNRPDRVERWRLAQALAWIRAAGGVLPELPSAALRAYVGLGDRVARFRVDWRCVALEALVAGAGVAVAYALRAWIMMLIAPPPAGLSRYLLAFAAGLNAASLGAMSGGVTVLIARFLAPDRRLREPQPSTSLWIVAVVIGFVLGLATGVPYELAYVSNFMASAPGLLGRYGGGSVLMGGGIAIGAALTGRARSRRSIVGGGLGGALAGLVIGGLDQVTNRVWLSNLLPQGGLVFALFQAALYGLLTGGGLVGGWLIGRQICQRWSARRASALFSNIPM